MRRCLAVLLLLFLPALWGCAGLSGIVRSPDFTPGPGSVSAVAPAPLLPGDTFTYAVGGRTVVERVESVEARRVVWSDGEGNRWITRPDMILPPRDLLGTGGVPVSNAVFSQATEVFPLAPGTIADYRYRRRTVDGAVSPAERLQCAVGPYGRIATRAGPFEAFRMDCVRERDRTTVYYAPSVAREVMVADGALFGSIRTELIAYRRGSLPSAPRPETAAAPAAAAPLPALAPPSAPPPVILREPPPPPSAPTHLPDPEPSWPASADPHGRFGIQLIAHRAPSRARSAWNGIAGRAGDFLSDLSPAIETHTTVEGHTVFRLVAVGFSSLETARQRCRALEQAGIACWARALAPAT